MPYSQFSHVHEYFPSGRYQLNSLQLLELMSHKSFEGIAVRVLHLGTIPLNANSLAARLSSPSLPRLDGIKITCLDGVIIIDEPSQGS